jgi:phosphoribosylanthranilate isomerase
MWVKICANTNLEDAKLAAELGADAVGFVFAPSKRQVTARQVAEIVPHLPAELEKIGVFTTRDADEIFGIVRAAGLTGVQLHGGLDVNLARRLRVELGDGVTIIQTLHWFVDGQEENAEAVAAQLGEIGREAAIDRVLVDSKAGNANGGSGVSFDWSEAQGTFAGPGFNLIVAGGLRPDNVAEAIATLQPWGVDVASGVEASPGRKDREKLQHFLLNAGKSQLLRLQNADTFGKCRS